MSDDALARLHHDHHHITKLVDGLRESTQAVLAGDEAPLELRADFDEFLRVANDELFEHFDREENALFPYLVEHLPDLEETVLGLEAGHDRMCGLLTRMERLVSLEDEAYLQEYDSLIALFARFDATHVKHSRIESDLLRSLGDRLDEDQRRTVARLLAEL